MSLQRLDLAAGRIEWAALALGAAARELEAAGEAGLIVDGTPERLRAEADRLGGLLPKLDAVRELAMSERRVRDAL